MHCHNEINCQGFGWPLSLGLASLRRVTVIIVTHCLGQITKNERNLENPQSNVIYNTMSEEGKQRWKQGIKAKITEIQETTFVWEAQPAM